MLEPPRPYRTVRSFSRAIPPLLDVLPLAALLPLVAVLGFAVLAALASLPRPAIAAAADPVRAKRGMVVSSQPHAARAGQSILARGGNAVDAAVATAFAVGVTQPFSAGIGGGGFLLIRLPDGEVVALDARETAPAAAQEDMYTQPGVSPRASVRGGLAVATPGWVRGLELAQARYGTLTLAEVLAPAIALARDGFPIGPYHARMVGYVSRFITPEAFPETARIQLADGKPPEVGWVLVQTDLAKTLEAIAKDGAEAFYSGPIASAMVDTVKRHGGILTLEDLAAYEPKLRKPVYGTYRGLELYSFPPPSSGGAVLIEALNVLGGFDLAALGAGSSASAHVIAEAMKLAFADRAVYMGDSDFVDIPLERLTSKAYGESQRARLGERAIEIRVPGQRRDDAGTTHLSVTDSEGRAVALTMTINTPFGSGITVPGTGIVMNNEMDDFAKAPREPNAYGLIDTRGANAIAPLKRPLSSMTPTIVLKDGVPFMVTGSPGGPRIISTTLLTILNVVDYGMDVQAAVAAPRIHHQWIPDSLRVEPEMPADVVDALRARGHTVDVSERHWSSAEAIVIDAESGWHYGGADPRSDGLAVGY